jgi:hypothetical protein
VEDFFGYQLTATQLTEWIEPGDPKSAWFDVPILDKDWHIGGLRFMSLYIREDVREGQDEKGKGIQGILFHSQQYN